MVGGTVSWEAVTCREGVRLEGYDQDPSIYPSLLPLLMFVSMLAGCSARQGVSQTEYQTGALITSEPSDRHIKGKNKHRGDAEQNPESRLRDEGQLPRVREPGSKGLGVEGAGNSVQRKGTEEELYMNARHSGNWKEQVWLEQVGTQG